MFGFIQHQGQRHTETHTAVSSSIPNRSILQSKPHNKGCIFLYSEDYRSTVMWCCSIGLCLSCLWHKSCKMDPYRELNTLDTDYSMCLINKGTKVIVRVIDMIGRPTLLVSLFLSICWADLMLIIKKKQSVTLYFKVQFSPLRNY